MKAIYVLAAIALVGVVVTTVIIGDYGISILLGVALGFFIGSYLQDNWPKPPALKPKREAQ